MLLRATLVSFDSTLYTAAVRADGSAPQTLTGVRVSRDIASADMVVGRRLIIATSDHGDPADLVVIAVYT